MKNSDIVTLALRVESFYGKLDKKITDFRRKYGIHCIGECSRCCEYPRIKASPLEFIPLAKQLWDMDRAVDIYRAITPDQTICIFNRGEIINLSSGPCGIYEYRGLICRLFGYVSYQNKNNSASFFTCRTIYSTQKEKIMALSQDTLYQELPFYPDIVKQFNEINPSHAMQKTAINTAIKKAIEVVYEKGYRPVSRFTLRKCA